ncbi:MAG: outer membrane beta-barrel protein [Cyclobacteriaceae bacterium]|jgi:hypothetical protein
MKKSFVFVFILLGALQFSWAQSQTAVTYSVGFGLGDLGDFVGKTSFRGISVDYRKLVQPNIGVGFTAGWNVFYEEKAYGTYSLDNQALSGKQYRYSNQFPVLLSGTYFLKPGEDLNPYFGLGAGTMYTLRNTDMSLYTLEQDAWHFSVVPEIGIQYSVDDSTALLVGVKYVNGFQAGDLDKSQSYLTLNVGFVFSK